MIRPAALYNKARFSRDFLSLGRVAAVLCGNSHIVRDDLTDSELSSLEEIENENDEMDKTAKKEAERKAVYRAKVSRNVPQCPTDNSGQGGRSVASATTEQPTNRPTNQTDTNRSVPDKGVRGESASVRLNVFRMSGEEFFGGGHSVIELMNSALGKGFWAKAIRQLGDAAVLEELWSFVCEVRAGEDVKNPGAVMTKRLKAKGVK